MLVSVAVPVPFLGALTYEVPAGVSAPPVGARVQVPVGPRIVTGCVVGVDAAVPQGRVKAITAVVDTEPLVRPEVVDLCRWVSDYYVSGLGDAIQLALPPGSSGGRIGVVTTRVVSATTAGLATLALTGDRRTEVRLTARQRDSLALLANSTRGLTLPRFREAGGSVAALRRLVSLGLAVGRDERRERDPFETDEGGWDQEGTEKPQASERILTPEQQEAMKTLGPMVGARRFGVALLHGVTGSGKTEVYLRLAQQTLQDGRGVLLLVPEIALTSSVAAVFRRTFGDRVAIQHSGLSGGERHDQWHRISRGEVDIVVGTRSAVFAPLRGLGLVIVDEEHDASYKQDETPRYHGRDVAIVRAQATGALVVLGSATPSIESFQNAKSGKYALVALRHRVMGRPLASVSVVNMRDEYVRDGAGVIISRMLRDRIAARLEQREQVMVLLNRRGYATAVFCRQCGDAFECPNCSVSLTVHLGPSRSRVPTRDHPTPGVRGRGRCHYCNYSTQLPPACRKCGGPYLEHSGFGTERVEADVRTLFPEARLARIDRDTVRRKGALEQILRSFARGELDVLVGTQMIAKGHDFPNVTLVGVISADVGLGLADFRASERTFQLLTQVAGRAGRGAVVGEAVIQTIFPEHYSVQLACRQDYDGFFEREVAFRRDMQYPPMVAMVNIVVRGRTLDEAMTLAGTLAQEIRRRATTNVVVLGPAPAPMERLRGEHRVQIFLKGTRRAEMREAVREALEVSGDQRRRITIDVDPLSVL